MLGLSGIAETPLASGGSGPAALPITFCSVTVGVPSISQVHRLTTASVQVDAVTFGAPELKHRKPFFEILPPNSTRLERSWEYPQRRLMELPVPIRDVWRWDTCPSELLPWLAWAMSVDLWNVDWPDTKKRAIIRDSFELHRRKGTLWAIERYLSFAGARLKRAIAPPDKPFPGRSMTAEERKAWLDRFPQIRVFRFRDRGTRTHGAFASGGAYKLPKTFLGDIVGRGTFFPYQTDAPNRYGRRAFLWDKGQHHLATGLETPLRWLERTQVQQTGVATTYEQVLIPGSAVQALFLGSFVRGNRDRKDGRWFPVASSAPTRIVSMRRDAEYTTETDVLHRFALRPSLEPIQAFPEHVAEQGTSKLGVNMFAGMPGRWLDPATKTRKRIKGFLSGFVPETTAPLRLYDRLHLHDPQRLPNGRPPAIYLGHFRLGMPAFHAELAIEVRGKRTIYEFGRFVFGHTTTADRTPLEVAQKAVQRSKAHRDKILLRTQLHKPINTSHGIRVGDGHRVGGLTAII